MLIDNFHKVRRWNIADSLEAAAQCFTEVFKRRAIAGIAFERVTIPLAIRASSDAIRQRRAGVFVGHRAARPGLTTFKETTEAHRLDDLDENLEVSVFVPLNRQATERDNFAIVVEEACSQTGVLLEQRQGRRILKTEGKALIKDRLEYPAFDASAAGDNSAFDAKAFGVEVRDDANETSVRRIIGVERRRAARIE